MRPALLLAAALALGALSAAATAKAAPAGADATTTNLRCLLVSGMLAQSDEPDLKDVGTVSWFYFWGRLEGHVPPGDIATRLIDQAKTMTAADLKAQAQVCANMSKAASQGIVDVNDALQKALGPPTPSTTQPTTAPALPETTLNAPAGK